jgi:hypothetical protein
MSKKESESRRFDASIEALWRFHTERNDASTRCFVDAGFFVIALTVPRVIRVHY